jgi:hypothetical protein
MPRDELLIALMRARDGVDTQVLLRSGEGHLVCNIAWGYDEGDEWAHVTTNISPETPGRSIDFFVTSGVTRVVDPVSGATLYAGT